MDMHCELREEASRVNPDLLECTRFTRPAGPLGTKHGETRLFIAFCLGCL